MKNESLSGQFIFGNSDPAVIKTLHRIALALAAMLILGTLLSGPLVGHSSASLDSGNQNSLYRKLGGLASKVGLVLPASFASWQSGSITMTSNVSSCYYTSGQSRKTVSVEVAWSGLTNPVTTITVSLPGAIGSTTRAISAQTTGNPPIVSPQVVAFEIPSTFTGTLTVSDSANSVSGTPINLTETGSCAPLVCASTDIGGTVYSDYNGDGARNAGDNPGVASVTVTAYDKNGLTYVTTSNSEGKYCLSVPTADYPVRVEFTSLPRSSGRVGTNSASSVQFISAPAQNVDLSISSPDGYCENDPWVMTSCYVFGDPLATSSTAATEPAMVRARYSQDGIKTGVQQFASAAEVGATYGVAYRKQSDRLFTSAILRRHSGFGPKGLGGIYVLNANSNSNTISGTGNVVDSWSVINQLGVAVAPNGSVFDGTNGATVNTARGLDGDKTQPSRDIDSFASIGKVGIGDIDLTPDGSTLFFINQFDRLLYSVDISGYNTANTATSIATRPTATISKDTAAAVTCSNGVWRPSALKVTGDFAYVGGVCDGSTGTRSDLRAKVLRIPLAGGWSTQAWTTVLDFPLTYPKGYAHGVFKDLAGNDSVKMWRTWTDNFFDLEIRPSPSLTVTSTTAALLITSVPLLSDIEIDVDGSIILSIGDRTGLQLGNANYAPVAAGTTTLATTSNQIDRQGAMTNSDNAICPIQFSGSRNLTGNTFYTNAVGGDILRGLIAGSSFILENGGRVGSLTGSSTSNNEGPGFGEFYADNFAYPGAPAPPRQFCGQDPHTEIAMGGLAVLPGSGEVVLAAMDPRDEKSGETAQINAGGFRYLNNANGAQTRSLVLYSLGDDQSTQLGKSSGLGDVELSCGLINYIEIGNRLWADTDGDGVQDPGEAGIAGVQVSLFLGGVQVGSSVTTNSEGRYLFNTGLLPNTAYEIRVSQTQMQALGYSGLTTANTGQGTVTDADLRDSDAVLTGGNGVISVTTGNNGEVNHTLDMGWQPQVGASIFEIGNRIWLDADMDGIQDAGEVGIDGIIVNLYKNGILVGQTTTAGGGLYLFNGTNVTLNGAMGLLPNMTYQISISTNTGPASGLFLSPPNNDPSASGDLNDSDALAVGNNAIITLTTGPTPQSNYSYDIGLGVMRVTLSDPATCLSPGGIVEILVEMGNPTSFVAPDGAGAELTIDLPTSVSRIVSASATTTSSGVGTITTSGLTILWNGALNPGDKLTLIYLIQIGNSQIGTQICPRSTAAYDANFDGVKDSTAIIDLCMSINCPAAGPGSPVPVSNLLSDQIAGSVLIFNIYSSNINTSRQDTRFTLTNVNPVDSTFVHLFFIDGQSCSAADRFLDLSPSQTVSFLASDIDPVTTGFLLAVATDQNGCPTRFNYLVGSEYVKFESGHGTNLGATAVPAPGQIVCNPASPSATLKFDGLSYGSLPRALAVDSVFSLAEGNQAMLIINRLGGDLSTGSTFSMRLFGLLFDDAERSSSFNLISTGCQLRTLISNSFPRSVPRYDQVVPAGRTGWIKLWSDADLALSGSLINYKGASEFSGGHNLHALTLTSTVTLTVPVYPPQ